MARKKGSKAGGAAAPAHKKKGKFTQGEILAAVAIGGGLLLIMYLRGQSGSSSSAQPLVVSANPGSVDLAAVTQAFSTYSSQLASYNKQNLAGIQATQQGLASLVTADQANTAATLAAIQKSAKTSPATITVAPTGGVTGITTGTGSKSSTRTITQPVLVSGHYPVPITSTRRGTSYVNEGNIGGKVIVGKFTNGKLDTTYLQPTSQQPSFDHTGTIVGGY